MNTAESVEEQIRRLGTWFHNIHLPGGEQTAPQHPLGDFPRCKWRNIAPHLPEDLRGWNVLDIGCNAGFYTIELARRGAKVIAVDADDRYLSQARWAVGRFGLEATVEFRRASIYELGREPQRFDLVLFMGVFYHLRYPLLGLDIAARKTDRFLLFQSLTAPDLPAPDVPAEVPDTLADLHRRDSLVAPGWPRMSFIEKSFAGDPTNWWVPNRAAIEAMLRSCALQVVSQPDGETFFCAPSFSEPVSPFADADYRAVMAMSPSDDA